MNRRGLQIATAILGAIPVLTGIITMFGLSDPIYASANIPANALLDSNLRFFGGVWLVLVIALYWLIPNIEKQTVLFRVLWGMIFLGGIGRLLSMVFLGPRRCRSSPSRRSRSLVRPSSFGGRRALHELPRKIPNRAGVRVIGGVRQRLLRQADPALDDILIGHRTGRGISAALAHDGIIPGLVVEAAGGLFEREIRRPIDQAEFYLFGVTMLLDRLEVGPESLVLGLEHDPVDVEPIEIQSAHTLFLETLLETIDPFDVVCGRLRRVGFDVAPQRLRIGGAHRLDELRDLLDGIIFRKMQI